MSITKGTVTDLNFSDTTIGVGNGVQKAYAEGGYTCSLFGRLEFHGDRFIVYRVYVNWSCLTLVPYLALCVQSLNKEEAILTVWDSDCT